MKRLTLLMASATLVAAALSPHPTHAAEVAVLDEGFGDLAGLSGWERINRSFPPGTGWFQGNPGIFAAHSGAPNAYAAANYLGAYNGMGVVDNWLITPTLTLGGLSTLSFYTNHELADGVDDLLEVRFGSGSSRDPAAFGTLLTTIGGGTDFPGAWQQWSTDLNFTGEGRFAFRYLGDAAVLGYVGLDTVRVVTAVPEPGSLLMLASGLGLLALLRRRGR